MSKPEGGTPIFFHICQQWLCSREVHLTSCAKDLSFLLCFEVNNHFYPKYWDIWTAYNTCQKLWQSPFYYYLMCLKYCWMGCKQCRPWSDATFCGIWSGSTLFAQSQYLGLLQYTELSKTPALGFQTGFIMRKGLFGPYIDAYADVQDLCLDWFFSF